MAAEEKFERRVRNLKWNRNLNVVIDFEKNSLLKFHNILFHFNENKKYQMQYEKEVSDPTRNISTLAPTGVSIILLI